MKVPFVDLKSQYISIKDEINSAVHEVLENTDFIRGKAVARFEKAFAETIGVDYCLGTGSGTDALHLALWSLGIKKGDEVITTPTTFIATTEAILLTGAKPVFVDVEELTGNILVNQIEEKITENTKAILPVHLFGHSCDMQPIMHLANKYNLSIIEDACQAHLAEYHGVKVGSMGRMGAFSFYPGKNLGAYGEAGAVVTNNTSYYSKMFSLSDHGQAEKYNHVEWGHNYRMDGLQGAVLEVKLKYLEKWTIQRRHNARLYNERLKDLNLNHLFLPVEMSYAKHVYHLYVIRTTKRDALKNYLAEKGISTGMHYPIPLHLQKGLKFLGYKEGDFPVAEAWAKEGLSLPMFPDLTESQIDYVCDEIKAFFN